MVVSWAPSFLHFACAQVLLWRLATALEQMALEGKVYFRPVTSSYPLREPRVDLILYRDLQFWSDLFRTSIFGHFWIPFLDFHKVWWFCFSSWGSFIGFFIWVSPISMSQACLSNVIFQISWKTLDFPSSTSMSTGRSHNGGRKP